MAISQEDIDALQTALGTGAKKVKKGDEEVEYRSISEMRAILADMKSQLAGGKRTGIAVVYPTIGRGL